MAIFKEPVLDNILDIVDYSINTKRKKYWMSFGRIILSVFILIITIMFSILLPIQVFLWLQ